MLYSPIFQLVYNIPAPTNISEIDDGIRTIMALKEDFVNIFNASSSSSDNSPVYYPQSICSLLHKGKQEDVSEILNCILTNLRFEFEVIDLMFI